MALQRNELINALYGTVRFRVFHERSDAKNADFVRDLSEDKELRMEQRIVDSIKGRVAHIEPILVDFEFLVQCMVDYYLLFCFMEHNPSNRFVLHKVKYFWTEELRQWSSPRFVGETEVLEEIRALDRTPQDKDTLVPGMYRSRRYSQVLRVLDMFKDFCLCDCKVGGAVPKSECIAPVVVQCIYTFKYDAHESVCECCGDYVDQAPPSKKRKISACFKK